MSKKVVIPLRWAGGKYYAIKILKKFWENVEHDEYREVFLGGGSVFWAKDISKFNWVNDKDEELVNFLEIIRNDESRDKLLAFFNNEMEASKEKYSEVKSLLPSNNLERAYKFYYLNRTSFSGKMKNPSWGYKPKRSLPPYRWHERIIPCSDKIKNVKLTSLDFEEVINAPSLASKTLMFLDPPYFKANQQNYYVHSFTTEDHLRLLEALKKCEHKFFLTYDDCEEIREMYSWAKIYEIDFVYRLENSKDNNNKRKSGNELVITNYEI